MKTADIEYRDGAPTWLRKRRRLGLWRRFARRFVRWPRNACHL